MPRGILEKFEISIAVLFPNTTTSHAITYTYVIVFSLHTLTEWQRGFMKGGSRVTQLILTHHYWTKALDDACQVYAAFLDFSKAFDSVSLSLV